MCLCSFFRIYRAAVRTTDQDSEIVQYQSEEANQDHKTSVQRLVAQAAKSDADLTVSVDWLCLVWLVKSCRVTILLLDTKYLVNRKTYVISK